MEKYTIDIDKVLDDFEETEALKFNEELGLDDQKSCKEVNFDEKNQSVSQSIIDECHKVRNENLYTCSVKEISQNSLHNPDVCSQQIENPDECDIYEVNSDINTKNFVTSVKPDVIKDCVSDQICSASVGDESKTSLSYVNASNGVLNFQFGESVSSSTNQICVENSSDNSTDKNKNTHFPSDALPNNDSSADCNKHFNSVIDWNLNKGDISLNLKKSNEFAEVSVVERSSTLGTVDFCERDIAGEPSVSSINNDKIVTDLTSSEQLNSKPEACLEISQNSEESNLASALVVVNEELAEQNNEREIVEVNAPERHQVYDDNIDDDYVADEYNISSDDDSGVSSQEGNNNSPIFFHNGSCVQNQSQEGSASQNSVTAEKKTDSNSIANSATCSFHLEGEHDLYKKTSDDINVVSVNTPSEEAIPKFSGSLSNELDAINGNVEENLNFNVLYPEKNFEQIVSAINITEISNLEVHKFGKNEMKPVKIVNNLTSEQMKNCNVMDIARPKDLLKQSIEGSAIECIGTDISEKKMFDNGNTYVCSDENVVKSTFEQQTLEEKNTSTIVREDNNGHIFSHDNDSSDCATEQNSKNEFIEEMHTKIDEGTNSDLMPETLLPETKHLENNCCKASESSENSADLSLYDSSNHINNNFSEDVSDVVNLEQVPAKLDQNSTFSPATKVDNLPQRLQRPTTLDLPSRVVVSQPVTENSNLFASNSVQIPCSVSGDSPAEDKNQDMLSIKQPSQIGVVKPFWIPDSEAPNCMHCGVKFTVIKRRHHCRACGKVLCSRCCNLKAKLAYLNKEDRICHPCFEIISSTSQNENFQVSVPDSQSSSSCGSSPNFSPSPQIQNSNLNDKNSWRPHPNNPDDYCSTIPPLQQIQLDGTRPPPTVMVPIGVLKRGNKPRKEPKQVMFSDGIRPGGDLTDLTEPMDSISVYRRMGRKRVEKDLAGGPGSNLNFPQVPFSSYQRSKQKRILVSDEEGPLPPIVLQIDNAKDEKLDWSHILEKMQDDEQKPVDFALMKNVHLFVKLTKLDCCFGKECWCFTSHGLCAVGQDEVMVILERLPDENTLPRGILKLFTYIYDSASKGSTFYDLGHVIFPDQILDSSDHRGFLFVRPTFQCLSKLVVPNTPFLVAILIHKWEVPWAKVFPIRLMLRLGAECRYYPCALVSVRQRKPVFFEIGQTIMSVLSDLRNYQFTIPVIPGLVVHMEEKKTCVNIPRNRYNKVMKVLNSNNVEHVLALGANFSSEADSHLVCMQKEEGDYQTQAINIENTTRRVTGASFIVFSGALKSSSGLSAKFSIVEDGLLVQIPQETMVALHMALRDMKDLTIQCGKINASEPEEVVVIQWTRDDKKFNIGVLSPIDCRSLEGIPSIRIHTSTDYAGENYLIRWTEVFFLEVDENGSSVQHELVDPCRLAETVAQSCCMALAPYLDQLAESELRKIGLRVTLDSERDKVEYDVGARGKPLPAVYMNALDSGLIPVILRLSGSTQSEPISFELIFHILIK